jgi:hypothetical protein
MTPTAVRLEARESTLVDAVADVASAAQRVVLDRAQLLHLELRDDARHVAVALWLGVAALGVGGTAVVAGTVALAWALAPMAGLAGGLAVAAGVGLSLASGLAVAARRVIAIAPAHDRLALEAGDEIDA